MCHEICAGFFTMSKKKHFPVQDDLLVVEQLAWLRCTADAVNHQPRFARVNWRLAPNQSTIAGCWKKPQLSTYHHLKKSKVQRMVSEIWWQGDTWWFNFEIRDLPLIPMSMHACQMRISTTDMVEYLTERTTKWRQDASGRKSLVTLLKNAGFTGGAPH